MAENRPALNMCFRMIFAEDRSISTYKHDGAVRFFFPPLDNFFIVLQNFLRTLV